MFYTPARIFTLAMLVVLAGATLTHAQAQFQYPNFNSTTGLQLNGDATLQQRQRQSLCSAAHSGTRQSGRQRVVHHPDSARVRIYQHFHFSVHR